MRESQEGVMLDTENNRSFMVIANLNFQKIVKKIHGIELTLLRNDTF